ncbi:extracellular solute-binding protein [Niameybacter massiliensis]|uniref:Extracellular solute-binding protein n=1 Tax=Holtiella tumoricola TaxID=3018743 RepID=A0AA42DN55_9FIRM|nr:extracellular solute-binding protein [Holtiella tumoricola]MDA3731916.1 extracellular solute-binding protein [Holtiella tumoricola]
MKKSLSIMLAGTMLMAMFTGCSSKKPDNVTNTTESIAKGEETGEVQNIDIWQKYDPPIEVSVVASYNVPEDGIVPKDTTPENQKWVEIMEKYLGIKLKYDWVVPASQGAQKMDVTIASGKIPNILQVDEGQFELLKQSDMIGDLTGAYDYLMEPIKKNLEADPTLLKKCTNEKGELVAIPRNLDNFQQTQLIYIREDWLEALGLQVPTSMDELFEVAKAFSEQDPDKNGKDDTIGIALYKELYAGFGGAAGLMNGYNAYPKMWTKDESGKLVCGDVQPEMRDALEMLQKMYKEGILDPEYVAMDSNKMTEAVVGGKAGIVLGEWWVPAWPLNLSIDNNPDARWKAINLVSAEGGIANTGLNQAFIGSYHVISKDMKNPEALAKMINIYYDTLSTVVSEREEEYDRELWKPENGYVYNWCPVRMDDTFENSRQYKELNEALKKDDITLLKPQKFKDLFEAAKRLETELNGTDWGLYYSRIAEDGGFGLTEKVRNEKLYTMNEFYGSYTPTMITSQGILDTLRDEVYHRIITGAPIEEFDKFVNDWHKMGGDQITNEVNDWYAKQ